MLVVIMIVEDTAAFQGLLLVSLFCAWNITAVEINSDVHLLKVKPTKCFCLLPVVSWSWSCNFGLGLVIRIWSCLHYWLLNWQCTLYTMQYHQLQLVQTISSCCASSLRYWSTYASCSSLVRFLFLKHTHNPVLFNQHISLWSSQNRTEAS